MHAHTHTHTHTHAMWYIVIPRLNIVCPPEPSAQIRTNEVEGVTELVNYHDQELTLHQLVGNGK